MKVYVIISTIDHNEFYSVVGVFYKKEDAVKYIYENGLKRSIEYFNNVINTYEMSHEDWDIIESEITPATNIL